MGVIKRQSIKNSIVNYAAVGVGAISVIFIYPLIDQTALGILQFAMNTAILFAPFAAYASSLTATQYFPLFNRNKKERNTFFAFMTIKTAITTALFLLVIYLFRYKIAGFFSEDGVHFINALFFILLFTAIIAMANLYQTFAAFFNRIVVPSLFQNLLIKLAQPALVLLFAFNYISFATIFKGMAIALGIMLMGLVGYFLILNNRKNSNEITNAQLDNQTDNDINIEPIINESPKTISPNLVKQMMRYSTFNVFVSMNGFLAQRLDQFLIPFLINMGKSAVFNMGFFISEAIDVPRKALAGIAAPLLAASLRENNTAHVAEIYRKTALLQLIVGTYLLAATWACADALFDLMPKNGELYRSGKYVILLLGLSRLVDMATGTNAEIITYSPLYRFNLISLLTMAVLNIALNVFFLKTLGMGIEGSALATLISVALVNLWRLLYIKKKMDMHPLSISMLGVLILGVLAWVIAFFLPNMPSPLLNIIAKGFVVTVVFTAGIVYFKVSEDVNAMVEKFIRPRGKN